MDRGTFFLIVESSRRHARDVRWASQVGLAARLHALSDGELEAFEEIYDDLDRSLEEIEVDGQSLHGLVYEAWGGCSDDSFMDFRSWVLWRGRETYEALCRDPVGWLQRGEGGRYEAAIFSPLSQAQQLREGRPPRPEPEPDPGRWQRRAEAERALLEGTLSAERLADDDPYVRALAWLAHPPPPDPELFDAPFAQRAAVYLQAARDLPSEHLDPLSALVWLDDHAPRRGLLPLLQQGFEALLAEAMAPLRPVLEGLDGSIAPGPEALQRAGQVLDALGAGDDGDVFARLEGLAVPEAAAALAEVAASRQALERSLRPALVSQTHPLAAAVMEGLSRGNPAGVRARRRSFARSRPGSLLALHRSRWGGDRVWAHALESSSEPVAVLSRRLAALEQRRAFAESDFLSLPAALARSSTLPGDLYLPPSALHPKANVALRWLLRQPPGWFEDQVRDIEDEGPAREAARRTFERRAVEALVKVCGGAPSDPEEQALLKAIQQAPDDEAPRRVYTDWCEQRERPPRPVALLVALRRAWEQQALLPRPDVALALARLGDAAGIGALIEGLSAQPELRPLIVPALWDLGAEALPALPALLSFEAQSSLVDLELTALRARLQPEGSGWREALLDKLPEEVSGLPEVAWQYQEGLITHDEREAKLRPLRRALLALDEGMEGHPALLPRLEALARALLSQLPEEHFPEELRRCRERAR